MADPKDKPVETTSQSAPAVATDDLRPETAAEAIKRADTTPINDDAPTAETPEQPSESSIKEADKEPGPYIGDAEADDAPVRTNRPDVPILQHLAVGAGAHTPNDSDEHDAMGRYIGPAAGGTSSK